MSILAVIVVILQRGIPSAPLENAIPILTNYADYKKAQEINAKIVNLGNR